MYEIKTRTYNDTVFGRYLDKTLISAFVKLLLFYLFEERNKNRYFTISSNARSERALPIFTVYVLNLHSIIFFELFFYFN